MSKGQMTAFGANIHWIMLALLIGLVILAIIVDAQYQLPANFRQKPITGIFSDILLFLGIPSNWLYVPAVIYLFFVPFIGIFAIIYGFLSEMDIFRAKPQINIVLALVFAFATIPIGAFVKLISLMFAVLGLYSVGAFGLLFFFGVIYVFLDRMGYWGFTSSRNYMGLHQEQRYHQLREWLLEVYRENHGGPSAGIVSTVPADLNAAETMWNARPNPNPRGAINRLQTRTAAIYSNLRTAGIHVRRPPR